MSTSQDVNLESFQLRSRPAGRGAPCRAHPALFKVSLGAFDDDRHLGEIGGRFATPWRASLPAAQAAILTTSSSLSLRSSSLRSSLAGVRKGRNGKNAAIRAETRRKLPARQRNVTQSLPNGIEPLRTPSRSYVRGLITMRSSGRLPGAGSTARYNRRLVISRRRAGSTRFQRAQNIVHMPSLSAVANGRKAS